MRIILTMAMVLMLFVAVAGAQYPPALLAPPPNYYPAYYLPPPPQPVAYVAYARPTWVGNFLFGPVYVPVWQQPQR